jgi:hypothetical protein
MGGIVSIACCEENGGILESKVDAEGTSESSRSFVGSTDGAFKRLEFDTPDGAADDRPSLTGKKNDGLDVLDGDADGLRFDTDGLSVGLGEGRPSSTGEKNDGLGVPVLDGDADGLRFDADGLSVGLGEGPSVGLHVALPVNVGAEVRF